MIVPLLILWLGYEEREATGTSLGAIVLIALFGVAGHGALGNVDLAKGLLIAPPAVAGVVAGTALQQRVPERAVSAVFAVLLVFSAALLVVALAAGMLGGMVGVGGGVLFVPGLVVFMDLSQLEAEATSLVAVVAVGAVGAWRQHGYGNLRPRDALVVGLLSPIGVAVGVVAANEMSERVLELLFAALSLYFAAGLAARALRGPEQPSPARPPR